LTIVKIFISHGIQGKKKFVPINKQNIFYWTNVTIFFIKY